jgi:hypothetical protein
MVTPSTTVLRVAPESTPLSPTEALREQGLEALSLSLSQLEPQLSELEQRVEWYTQGCAKVAYPLPDPGCVALQERIGRLAREVEDGLAAADEAARQAWVQPGDRRRLRRDHGLGEAKTDRLIREARGIEAGRQP